MDFFRGGDKRCLIRFLETTRFSPAIVRSRYWFDLFDALPLRNSLSQVLVSMGKF